jgi:hypothetical protein
VSPAFSFKVNVQDIGRDLELKRRVRAPSAMARELNVYLVISIRVAAHERKVMRVLIALLRYLPSQAQHSKCNRFVVSASHRNDSEGEERDEASAFSPQNPKALPQIFVNRHRRSSGRAIDPAYVS